MVGKLDRFTTCLFSNSFKRVLVCYFDRGKCFRDALFRFCTHKPRALFHCLNIMFHFIGFKNVGKYTEAFSMGLKLFLGCLCATSFKYLFSFDLFLLLCDTVTLETEFVIYNIISVSCLKTYVLFFIVVYLLKFPLHVQWNRLLSKRLVTRFSVCRN